MTPIPRSVPSGSTENEKTAVPLMEGVKSDDRARCLEVPVHYAPPLDRPKFVKTEGERLALLSKPGVLLLVLRLEIERYMK